MSATPLRLPRNVVRLTEYGTPDPGARRRWLDLYRPHSAGSRYRSWLVAKMLRSGRRLPS